MKYLLDTMAFYRTLDNTLPKKVTARLKRAEKLFVSIVTPWEVVLKPKLRTQMTNEDLQDKIIEIGAQILPITLEHTGLLYTLPFFPEHRDPFDRMLIVQAISERCMFVSSDRMFERYRPRLQVLWD